ncbi:MAG: hypothetical protein ACE5OQ_14220 [Woeseia sp.]
MLKITKILVWSIIFQGVTVAFSGTWAAAPDGESLFEKRCSACHKLPDPGQPPPMGWAQQLELMVPLARLKENQKQAVLDYLISHSQQAAMAAALDEDRLLFEEKCSRCHTVNRVLLSPLHGDSLRHVINRMQGRSGTDWLSDQDVERVLVYLDTAPREVVPSAPVSGDSTAAEIFVARCSACHSLERIFLKLDEDPKEPAFWSHTVSRMRGKAPQWVSESEAGQILEYLRSSSPVQR